MRSPRHMRIIEIDITNACDKRCSNCTRLCGHHKKPYFMSFDTFKRAVDSLDGYHGIRSMMGGEPTLHPEFEHFIRYLGSKFPKRDNPYVYPQKDFIKQVHRVELDNFQMINDDIERIDVVGAGMFSNMGVTYKKHYEIISDILPFQGLNDHLNPVYHQSALITRKDLGIADDKWLKLRDACWLQNEWSASITPKGAFFCEIAGVLDMLFDGPGGWVIEPEWWKRAPDEFGDQLHWCEMCGFALDTFTRDSAEEIDDVSPTMFEMLKGIDSPKLKSGRVNLIRVENGKISEDSKKENKHFSAAMPYIEHYEDRFNALNSILFVREFDDVTIAENDSFGTELNKALANAKEWLLLYRNDVKLPNGFKERLSKYVLNPGTLHVSDDFALFSKNALSLREFGFDRIAHTKTFGEIINAWQPNKVIPLSFEAFDKAGKRLQVNKETKYVIWGTGSAGDLAVDIINSAGGKIVLAVDKDCYKHGKDFYGVTIQPPGKLLMVDFDVLIAANYTRFTEIKREAVAIGIPADKIQYINSLA